MDLMTIGAFAERTRLSPKALRLYDRLGLLPPVRTDPVSGYRFYSEGQVAGARLVALLRRLGMPLPVIADIVAKPPGEAAEAVGRYWAGVESVMADPRQRNSSGRGDGRRSAPGRASPRRGLHPACHGGHGLARAGTGGRRARSLDT